MGGTQSRRTSQKMAEREGFEPPGPCGPAVFKTAAIDHSATSPSTHSPETVRETLRLSSFLPAVRTPAFIVWRVANRSRLLRTAAVAQLLTKKLSRRWAL